MNYHPSRKEGPLIGLRAAAVSGAAQAHEAVCCVNSLPAPLDARLPRKRGLRGTFVSHLPPRRALTRKGVSALRDAHAFLRKRFVVFSPDGRESILWRLLSHLPPQSLESPGPRAAARSGSGSCHRRHAPGKPTGEQTGARGPPPVPCGAHSKRAFVLKPQALGVAANLRSGSGAAVNVAGGLLWSGTPLL